jgi:hypothetical protein
MANFEKLSKLDDPTSKYYVEDLNYPVISKNKEKNDIFGKIVAEDFVVPSVVRNLKVVKEMPIKNNDTIIIGYPKSGKFFSLILGGSPFFLTQFLGYRPILVLPFHTLTQNVAIFFKKG